MTAIAPLCRSWIGSARVRLLAASLALIGVLTPGSAGAFYVPFPSTGLDAASRGALALIVMDRDRGEVVMVPTLRLGGRSADFVLVVPTPSFPEIAPAPSEIWNQAERLTRPLFSTRGADEPIFDCGEEQVSVPLDAPPFEGVLVPWNPMIRAVRAATLSPEDPGGLVRWLDERGYGIADQQAARFAPFAERGWFFSILRPDSASTGIEMPPEGWDHNVEPMEIRFQADPFEIPLPILAVNREGSLPMILHVIDDHRMTLPGFETTYANRLNEREVRAIEERYPALSGVVAPGRYFTRLRRVFRYDDPMGSSLRLERAPNDDELRFSSLERGWRAVPDLALLPIPVLLLRGLRMVGRRRRGGTPGSAPPAGPGIPGHSGRSVRLAR
jgi:hypothetical protein